MALSFDDIKAGRASFEQIREGIKNGAAPSISGPLAGSSESENKNSMDDVLKQFQSAADRRNQMKGQKTADYVSGKPLLEFPYAAVAGLENFAEGLNSLTQQHAQPPSSVQYASSAIRENMKDSPVKRAFYDLTTSTANMAPALALSAMTGSGGLGSLLTGVSSGGNAKMQALQDGYSNEEALLYGAVNGALEGGLQYALGGISKLGKGGISKLVSKAPAIRAMGKAAQSAIKNPVIKNALKVSGKYIANMGDEAFEEYLQSVLDPVVRNVILKEDNEIDLLSEDALYSALLGALSAGLLNLPGTVSEIHNGISSRSGNQIVDADGTQSLGNTENVDDSANSNLPPIDSGIEGINGATIGSPVKDNPAKYVQPDLSPEAKSNRASVVRETGTALNISPDIVDTVAKVAEQTGRNIQFVETLGEGINGKYDAQTSTLYIAADSPNPEKTVLKHELTHSLEGTKAYADLSDYILSEAIGVDAEKAGIQLDDVIQAKIIQYEQAGETLSRDAAVKELIADYVGDNLFTSEQAIRQLSASKPSLARRILNWIRSIKTALFGTKQEKMLDHAEKLYHDALMAPYKKGDWAQNSIGYTTDNKPVVIVEDNILDGVPRSEWVKKVKQTISEKFSDGIPVGGRLVRVNLKTRNEYTKSKDSQKLETRAPITYQDKFKSANNLDEIVLASTNYVNEDLKHERKDNFKEFARGDVLIRVGDKDYKAKVIVGFTTGNQMVLYDVIDFVPTSFSTKKEGTQFAAQSQKHEQSSSNVPSDVTVPQSADSVNTSISNLRTDDTASSSIGVSSGDTMADWKALVEKYGAIKSGEAPARDIQVPQQTSDDTRTRQFVRTALESSQVPDSFVGGITQDIMDDVYSYVPVSNEEAMKRAVSTVEDTGMEQAVKQWEAAVNGKRGPDKYDMALGEYLLTLAGKNNDPALASKMIIELSTAGTNAGQVVQAMSMLKRMTPEGRLLALQRVADRINRERPNSHVKVPESVIDKIQKTNPHDTESIDNAVQEGLVALADQVPSTWLDKWNAWRYLAMLGNPRTHVRNVVGNAVLTPVVYTKNMLAGAIEGAVDKASKAAGGKGITRTKTALAALPFAKRQDYLDFARQDYQQVKAVLEGNGNRNPADVVRDNQTVFKSKLMKPVEKARKANFKAMEAEDLAFKRLHYQRALMQYLAANKIDVSNVDAETLQRGRNYAVKEAQKATFADESALANALSRFSRTNKAAQFIVEGTVPFKKTPINVLKRAVEYSPGGLLDTVIRKAYQLKKGDINAAEFIDNLAAGLTGTGIMALGMWLQSIGVLVGGVGDDKDDKFDQLQGKQEYAIQVGDTSYTIDWASPAALPLLVGAELESLRTSSKDGEIPFAKMLEALTNLSEPIVNMSMLQGINDSIENVKFSDNPLTDMAMNAGASYLSQGVPTILGQVARTIDDKRRRNYVEQGSAFPSLQMAAQRSKSKIPGVLQTQQPYVDAWGREEPTGEWWERAFGNFISPGYTSKIQTSDMEKELKRLYKETGEGGVLPASAGKSVTSKGEKYVLTANEYTAYQREMGEKSYDMLTELTNSAGYGALTDEQKAKAVPMIYSYARESAKEAFMKSRGIEYEVSSDKTNIDDAVRNGVSMADYVSYEAVTKDVKADKDKNGNSISGSKKKKLEAIIDQMGLTRQQKNVLLALDGYGSDKERERILSGKANSTSSTQEIDIDRLWREAIS